MKALLGVICSLTLLATAYLSLSIAILRPPRASYSEWFLMAGVVVLQDGVTLAALVRRVSGAWICRLLVAIGASATLLGASWVRATVSASHLEGYAVVLGSMLAVQGVITVCAFWRERTGIKVLPL